MGDRANVVIQEEGGGKVVLYTHWGGECLPSIVASALRRGRNRWADESYLTRIVFSEMIQDSVLDETGFGISTWEAGDAQHPPIVLDIKSQTVIYGSIKMSFADFCNIKEE